MRTTWPKASRTDVFGVLSLLFTHLSMHNSEDITIKLPSLRPSGSSDSNVGSVFSGGMTYIPIYVPICTYMYHDVLVHNKEKETIIQ